MLGKVVYKISEPWYNVQVCVHYDGKLYEFVPWNGVVSWEMSPWGYWYMTAENETHMVIFFVSSSMFILFHFDT